MTDEVDETFNKPTRNQLTLEQCFRRYQSPPGYDAIANIRARALKDATRAGGSTKVPHSTRLVQNPSSVDESPQYGYAYTEAPISLASNIPPNGHMSSPSQKPPSNPQDAYPTPLVSTKAIKTTNLRATLSPTNSGQKRSNDFDRRADEDATPRAAKRSRSASAEPRNGSLEPSSSTELSTAPPTSQLSVPASLKSLPPALSQERPIYVPSSQSDENYDVEERTLSSFQGTGNADPDSSDAESEASLSSLESVGRLLDKFKDRSPLKTEGSSKLKPRNSAYKGSYDEKKRFSTGSKNTSKADEKYSLSNLLKLHDKEVSAAVEMAKAEAELNDYREDEELSETIDNKAVLASVVKDDDGEGNVDKVLQAMDRAEVMNTEIAWRFFGDEEQTLPCVFEFPSLTGELSGYEDIFREGLARDSTFLTGVAAEITSSVPMPGDLGAWLWQAAVLETNDELALAYLTTLKTAKLVDLFDVGDVVCLFDFLNRKADSMGEICDIKPIQKPIHAPRHRHPERLPRVLNLITLTPHCMSQAAKTRSLEILLRLAIDTGITDDIEVKLGLQRSIAAVVESLPEEFKDTALCMVGDGIVSLRQPVLQHRLLSSVPNTSPRLHVFKRRLAISFFLASSELSFYDLDPLWIATQLPRDIINRIKTNLAPQLREHEVDYRSLAAQVSILDIAIDSGFLIEDPSHSDMPTRAAASPAADAAATAPRDAAESAHNAAVDAIRTHVHVLFARIVDSGASHMARTEVKAVLERLINRLEYGVRTAPRERKSIVETEGRGGAASTMRAWIQKGARTREPDGVDPPNAETEHSTGSSEPKAAGETSDEAEATFEDAPSAVGE